jgi:ABC-type glycerol-3-phosphate transport system substrate-binding protein
MTRWLGLLLAIVSLVLGCGGDQGSEKVRRIVYWEKWTSFEGDAMDRVVDAFNAHERDKAKQNPSYVPIEVQKVTISNIEQKLMVAIAGGNPPDVAGNYSSLVPAYADKGALTDLGPYAEKAGIKREDYIEHFWDISVYKKKLWALPTTPASIALHWNKRLFREAGLDAEAPPKTIEQLDAFAEKLTKWEVSLPGGKTEIRTGYLPDVPVSQKRLLQAGFLPSEPGWWNFAWGFFFGGKLLDESGKASANSPENVRAYEWVASYTKKLGIDAVQRFRSGFGNFSSPNNPFLSGKIAMEVQGVWMYNFINMYSPGMQWGAAPFPVPADHPGLYGVSMAEADVIEIPKDSKHPEEAFEFIKYVSSQEGMELLCSGQKKFSPLKNVSDKFWREHPHPFIRMFRDLSMSPHVFATPKVGVWNEYGRELNAGVDVIQNLTRSPKVALDEVEVRVQTALDRNARISSRRGE